LNCAPSCDINGGIQQKNPKISPGVSEFVSYNNSYVNLYVLQTNKLRYIDTPRGYIRVLQETKKCCKQRAYRDIPPYEEARTLVTGK
jgi:hypothetical protein